MTIVGFGFNKINVGKLKPLTGKININNNISIKGIDEAKLDIGPKQKALRFSFAFIAKYEPDMAIIELEGDLTLLEDNKKADDLLAAWKKDKKVPKDKMAEVLGTALNKSNIQALILSQTVNLPPPIQLPQISKE